MAVLRVAILAVTLLTGSLSECKTVAKRRTDKNASRCPHLRGACSADWVTYKLYDRQSRLGRDVAVTDSWNNLTDAGYNPILPTALLIHGFADSPNQYTLVSIKDELLKTYNMSVLFLDWSKAVPEGCYISAVYNTRYAGGCLAAFVDAVGRPSSGLHIIGFSLGAHVPASAADILTPYKVPRITGLDPALPLFYGFPSQRRLRKNDGGFVDVIHTNAFIQGHMLPLGHIDFFVNGGTLQPGCGRSIPEIISCSHARAPMYYAESINTQIGFWGCKTSYIHIRASCNSSDLNHLMGYHVKKNLRGIVIVKTGSQSPFALGRLQNENDNFNLTTEYFNPHVDSQ